ncbi:hypothetical protein [Deminuibacter soli]|uniref:Uncharacterized protein n=1 Tax=Deminuibacter soli TaxID=2291815 RepID=A0A3E1NJE5_9BACT|nr:hypothetical protein [Deminuibacter soli]RFM28042.1 hypothetical protein DXN05_10915 [Deminuibacter soli]
MSTVNYADKVFVRTFTHEGKKLYASFHPEVIIDRDEYETTGRYLVVLLHPTLGLESFYLNYHNEAQRWLIDDNAPEIVEDELLEWLGNQVETPKAA